MLIKQPFYMGGIDDVELAKSNAFGAAATFLFTFIISILYMIRDARRQARGLSRDDYTYSQANSIPNPYAARNSAFRDFDLVGQDELPDDEFDDDTDRFT
jgi:hypothetical protein